jgi:hypothetical protein
MYEVQTPMFPSMAIAFTTMVQVARPAAVIGQAVKIDGRNGTTLQEAHPMTLPLLPRYHAKVLTGYWNLFLFVDREIVEAWRRSGVYLGHGKNSYDEEYIVTRRSRKADKSGKDRFRSQPPLFSPKLISNRSDRCRDSPWPMAAT